MKGFFYTCRRRKSLTGNHAGQRTAFVKGLRTSEENRNLLLKGLAKGSSEHERDDSQFLLYGEQDREGEIRRIPLWRREDLKKKCGHMETQERTGEVAKKNTITTHRKVKGNRRKSQMEKSWLPPKITEDIRCRGGDRQKVRI